MSAHPPRSRVGRQPQGLAEIAQTVAAIWSACTNCRFRRVKGSRLSAETTTVTAFPNPTNHLPEEWSVVRRLANQVALALVAVLGLTSFAAAGATSKLPPTADCATIASGSHGPAIVTLQRAVKATPDGDFGPLTAKAVATWQRKHGLKQTGAVDAATWKALAIAVGAAACGQRVPGAGVPTTCTTLQVGPVGPAVAVLQSALRITVD